MSDSDKYPPMADPSNIAKNWEAALLQDCGERRMKSIAKDFGLTGYSSLVKEKLLHLLFNHMTTLQDCVVCRGDCDPNKHLFPATEDAPPGHVSPTPRQTRKGTASNSPSSFVLRNDASKDKPVDDNTCLLYTSPSPRDVEESRMPSSA